METLLNKKQLAEILKVSVKTIDLWLRDGFGPKPIRLGRLVRYRMTDIQEFLSNLATEE